MPSPEPSTTKTAASSKPLGWKAEAACARWCSITVIWRGRWWPNRVGSRSSAISSLSVQVSLGSGHVGLKAMAISSTWARVMPASARQ